MKHTVLYTRRNYMGLLKRQVLSLVVDTDRHSPDMRCECDGRFSGLPCIRVHDLSGITDHMSRQIRGNLQINVMVPATRAQRQLSKSHSASIRTSLRNAYLEPQNVSISDCRGQYIQILTKILEAY